MSNSDRDPFTALIDLAQHSVKYASGLPAQLNIKPHWTGIGFQLGGHRMVAPMGEVAEIFAVPSTTRLPGVQSWVRGVANVRGRLLPLIDLEAFFGGSLSGGRKAHRVLALELGDLFSGLVVSQVFGMQHIPVDQFSDQVPAGLESMSGFLAGSYQHSGHEWAVFSPFVLARDTRFFNAAA